MTRKIPESAPITQQEYENLPPKMRLIVDNSLDFIDYAEAQMDLIENPEKAKDLVTKNHG